MKIEKKSKNNNLFKKNLILAVLVVAIAVIPLLFLKNAEFTGSDDKAKAEITSIDKDYKPWSFSIWKPPSSEIESLLFSLQAAIGSGVVCYFFGYSRGKSKAAEGKKVLISIDKLAYISELRKVNPMEKFMFAMVTMIICISLNNIVDSVIILLLMSFITVFKGRLPLKTYIELMCLPLVFLIMGVLTIAINVGGTSTDLIFSFSVFNIKLGCTYGSLLTAATLFFKSLASVSCLYFLTLTTPVFEILSVLRKLKVPKLFVELMGLIYRFIFVLLDTANMIYISQNSRLGYSNFRISFNSLGKLVTSLFISSYKRSQDIYTAMESRCYDGDINLLENNYAYSYRNISLIIVIEIALIIISFSKNILGGFFNG